ncbi:MAG: hypothetical protein NTV11_09945, partial [Rhodocyclales bacterium]|nr:hypothetical protein [Rhodocyclales bacterium]
LHSFHRQFPELRCVLLLRYLLQLRFSFQFAGALYPISWKTKFRGKLSVATMLFLTAGMIAAINGIYSAVLSAAILPAWLASGIGALVPASFGATVAAIVSARIVGAAYDLAMGKVKVINSAN